jgi:hypothetical protein
MRDPGSVAMSLAGGAQQGAPPAGISFAPMSAAILEGSGLLPESGSSERSRPPPLTSASPRLQRLHTEYSRHCNRRWGRSAHLFRAHPFARMIESDEDHIGTARCVARNGDETTPCRSAVVKALSGACRTKAKGAFRRPWQ